MARAGERNIPTLTAQQATIDLLKQPLLEINYFIEVMVIQLKLPFTTRHSLIHNNH